MDESVMLMKPNDPAFMTAEQAAQRRGYAAESELALRNAMEVFLRERRPCARMCHEMVMGERKVRADVVAVDTDHIIAVEVKGEYDDTTRLLHQVGMYQLCVPEVWIVAPTKHSKDARLIRHLIPSIGLLIGSGMRSEHGGRYDQELELKLTVEAEAEPRAVVPEMMLEMMWRAELAEMCRRTRVLIVSAKSTRPNMIKALLPLPVEQLQREVCIELRRRNALWRADAPISEVSDVQ
jgi:hypothetical protein